MYLITPHIPNLKQLYCFFFSLCIRMSRRNVIFGDKEIKKVTFTKTKNS